jgi:hypothetical protein
MKRGLMKYAKQFLAKKKKNTSKHCLRGRKVTPLFNVWANPVIVGFYCKEPGCLRRIGKLILPPCISKCM